MEIEKKMKIYFRENIYLRFYSKLSILDLCLFISQPWKFNQIFARRERKTRPK